jgi:hypothetical protein
MGKGKISHMKEENKKDLGHVQMIEYMHSRRVDLSSIPSTTKKKKKKKAEAG